MNLENSSSYCLKHWTFLQRRGRHFSNCRQHYSVLPQSCGMGVISSRISKNLKLLCYLPCTYTLQIIVNTVSKRWMSDLNIRPHPIPTKVSRTFGSVLDKALGDEKNTKVDGLVRGKVEENSLPFLFSFTPLISYFLLSHFSSCKWLVSFSRPKHQNCQKTFQMVSQ